MTIARVTRNRLAQPTFNQSVEFFGTGTGDADRIKISRVSNPSANNGADIGAGDMTLELWIRTKTGNNSSYSGSGGSGTYTSAAIVGNALIDCDVYNRNPAFVWTLTSGRLTFGWKTSGGDYTLVGSIDLRDGAWHHIAVCRTSSSGLVAMYVDGERDGTVTTLTGDLSYPGGTPEPEGEQGDTYMVLGAEKHDAGASYPSFRGYMTELRVSNSVRYSGASFSPPTARFTDDANTEVLMHMTESSGTTMTDSSASGANGTLQTGAARSTASPF